MSSIKSIAKDLGVSSATVSNALSGKGRVSEAMVERIRHRASDLGYQPSMAARALKTGRSGILGLVMPDLTNPLFPRLAQSVETAATKAGYGVLIADSRGSVDDQAAAIQRLSLRGVDGLVIVPHRGTRPLVKALPAAVIHTPSDPENTVSSDHCDGGRQSAQGLIDLGHRRFLLIGGDSSSEVQQDRLHGMKDAIRPVGTFQVYWANEKFPDLSAEADKGFTAVLTTSDLIALRVLGDAHQAGLDVPRQLSVIGFDDLPLGTAVRPMLSTVGQDVTRIADVAIAYLQAEIEEKAPAPHGVAVQMTLILRDSTTGPPSTQQGE